MATITVQTDPSYDITIAADGLSSIAHGLSAPRRVCAIVDDNVADTHGATVVRHLDAAGVDVVTVTIDAVEKRKTLAAVEDIYTRMLEARLDRSCIVIAVGGGLTGDLAGFVAATFMRGVPVIQVPTTLLAMVDASIGGKTAVNFPLPGDAGPGKNLIGAFWQPRAVIVDPATLATLPDRHLRCGLAECIKHGMLAGDSLLDMLERDIPAVLERDTDALLRVIEACAAVKAEVVASDERESGRRALLNLGHTFAHAIEPISKLDLYHGEAVAIGLCAAMQCAIEHGVYPHDNAQRVRDLIERAGLPHQMRTPIEIDRLCRAMGYDKKTEAGRVRLILPHGPGDVRIHDDVGDDAINAAWASVS